MIQPSEPPQFLDRWHAAALVAGSMVGVGIFLTPRIVAQAAGTGPLFFAIWGLGAVVALAGALAVAELGAMLPHAGGDYVYLRTAYGDATGFLYGWLSLLAAFSGAVAAMAVGIPRYQGPLLLGEFVHVELVRATLGPVTWTLQVDQVIGIGLVWALTLLACLRVRIAGRVQLTVTTLVMATLVVGASAGLLSGHTPAPTHALAAIDRGDWVAVAQAFTAVFFSYSGWNTAGYVAAEIRDPGKDLPWALVSATVAVGVLYLLLNGAFVSVLGDVGSAAEAGSATARALLGVPGGRLMAVVIAGAVIGAMLATLVGGSRIYFAMARDGLFFASAGRLHPRLHTPVHSLVVQAGWVTILIASSTFEDLLRWSTLAMMALSVLTIVAVPRLRATQPGLARPFRAWGVPWTTVAYVVPCVGVIAASVWERPIDGIAGVVATGGGLLAHAWQRRRLSTRSPGRSP